MMKLSWHWFVPSLRLDLPRDCWQCNFHFTVGEVCSEWLMLAGPTLIFNSPIRLLEDKHQNLSLFWFFVISRMLWIREIELAYSIQDFKTSQSCTGRVHPTVETLDARSVTALRNVVRGSKFRTAIFFEEQSTKFKMRIASCEDRRSLF